MFDHFVGLALKGLTVKTQKLRQLGRSGVFIFEF